MELFSFMLFSIKWILLILFSSFALYALDKAIKKEDDDDRIIGIIIILMMILLIVITNLVL